MDSKMQAVLLLPLSPTFKYWYSPFESREFDETSGKCVEVSRTKLRIGCKASLKSEDENLRNETAVGEEEIVNGEDEYETGETEEDDNLRNETEENLRMQKVVHGDYDYETEENEEEKEEEFSFDCTNPNALLVAAEDVFENGRIRPMFPIFDCTNPNASPLRPLLKNLSIQRLGIATSSAPPASKMNESGGAPEGPNCDFPGKSEAKDSSERRKKSYSKLRRFRDLFRRSNRGEQDAFISLNCSSRSNSRRKNGKIKVKLEKTSSENGAKATAASSSLEKYYMMNKVKVESDKRKSYLPYKFGLFSYLKSRSMKCTVHPC